MKRILTGRTVSDAQKILKKFNDIRVRIGFNGKFKKYLGFAFLPEYIKLLEIKNVFSDIQKNENVIFLTV